jgi:hypothetical protein
LQYFHRITHKNQRLFQFMCMRERIRREPHILREGG